MRLTFQNRKRDVLFAGMTLAFRNRVLRIVCLVSWAYASYSWSAGIGHGDFALRIAGIIVTAILVAVFFFVFQLAISLLLLFSSRNLGVLGEHAFEISEEGLEETTTINKTMHRWNSEFRVKEFGPYFWIYPTDGQCFMVPKNPQFHQGDLAGFLALLKSKMKQAAA